MSYILTEEQQLIQQTARDFAKEYLEPVANEIDHKNQHPQDIVEKMAGHDFLGLFMPGEYGGAEAGYLSYVLIVEELAKVSGAVASILINHSSLAAYAVNRWGTASQKEQYLSAMCTGEKLGAFAYAEPGAAPGAGPQRVVAEKQGDNYVFNGRKYFVGNGGVAGVYVVFALTNPEAGAKGMSAFLVDAGTPGLTVARHIDKMGLKGCQTAELVFENVTVSQRDMLGTENAGLTVAMETFAVANVAAGAQVVGLVQAALDDAVKYAKQRIQFGRPISSFPAVQNMLADMATNVHLARLAVYHAADLIEKGEPFAAEAAIVQKFISRIGKDSLIDGIQVEGGYGYSEEMLMSRLYRDVTGAILTESSAEYPEKTIAANLLA